MLLKLIKKRGLIFSYISTHSSFPASLFLIISVLMISAGILSISGCSGSSEGLNRPRGAAYGIITDSNSTPLENAKVSIYGPKNYTIMTDKDGHFGLVGMEDGLYRLVAEKPGYRSNEKKLLGFMIYQGGEQNLNVTLYKDCDYFIPDKSVDYSIRYGYSGTLYRGDVTFILPYPEGASYTVSPDIKEGLSDVSTFYRAGNRMLIWTLNNSGGTYPSVQGQIYIDMKGTKTLRLLERKEMKISDASSGQPGYLGVETDYDGKRAMIDPSDREIKALAEKIKSEAKSDDAWIVANALYVWVKTNNLYHVDLNSNYTQSAIEVLHSRRGDCDELSFLYISLCRAVGIPARFVTGYWVMDKQDGQYVAHAWAEFYYGEWAPVEITELWNSDPETIKPVDSFMINRDNAIFFAVDRPDHIADFVDDGTRESMGSRLVISHSYGQEPSFSPYTYYDAKGKGQAYVAYCADGTRREVEKIE